MPSRHAFIAANVPLVDWSGREDGWWDRWKFRNTSFFAFSGKQQSRTCWRNGRAAGYCDRRVTGYSSPASGGRMTVNGHRLPAAFLRALASGSLRWEVGPCPLRSGRDAFGLPLQTELAEVYDTPEAIGRATADLPVGFEPNGVYGASLPEMAGPGAIPDIVDFGGVVCFGVSGDDAPFCFDYRGGGAEPRVIWWNDVYWRVVAPDFASFLSLFDLPDAQPAAAPDPAGT